jgi:hypothetical protein
LAGNGLQIGIRLLVFICAGLVSRPAIEMAFEHPFQNKVTLCSPLLYF